MMKWSKFKEGLDLALKVATTYAYGGFGWPLNDANKKRLLQNKDNADFSKAINGGTVKTFAFDCVCLIKAILWGWSADSELNYGGSTFKSNGVPDVNADQMMTSTHVNGLSTDFSKIKVGALVGMKRHIGVYIGNGKVIECTPIWGAKVMTTNLTDRNWVNWGMSKYIDYSELDNATEEPDFKPYELVLPVGTLLYDDKWNAYSLPIGYQRTVTISAVKNGYGLFYDNTLKGTDHAWVILSAIGKPEPKPPVKPTFKEYDLKCPKGTILYDDKFNKYSLPFSSDRTVRIIEEKNGFGKFVGELVGTDHAWVELKPASKPEPTKLKVGDIVSVKLGSVYQNRTDGKKVESWASKQKNAIVKIAEEKAHVGGNINSWLLLKDLVKV